MVGRDDLRGLFQPMILWFSCICLAEQRYLYIICREVYQLSSYCKEKLFFVIKGPNSQVLFSSTAIRSHSPAKPVLVFVSSRRQTRLTALDLIAFLATEDDPKQWLKMDEREVESFYLHYLCFFSILLMFVWKENTPKTKESFEGRYWNRHAYARFQYVLKLMSALKLSKHLCKIWTLEHKLFYFCFSCVSIINASSVVQRTYITWYTSLI